MFFPQNRQLTGLHNSVLEDKRAQLTLTSIQERRGHVWWTVGWMNILCYWEADQFVFFFVHRLFLQSVGCVLNRNTLCALNWHFALLTAHLFYSKISVFTLESPALNDVFWKSAGRKGKSDWPRNQNKYWVTDMVIWSSHSHWNPAKNANEYYKCEGAGLVLGTIRVGGSSLGTEGCVRACDVLVASWAAQ